MHALRSGSRLRLLQTMCVVILLAGLGCRGLPPLVSMPRPTPVIVFEGVRVFTGRSASEVLDDRDVVVEGDRITGVYPAGEGTRKVTGPAERKTCRNCTLLPGFVDAHVHVGGTPYPPWKRGRPDPRRNLEGWLWAGITTVYDLGGDGDDLEGLKAKIASGALLGPRILHTGSPITAPGAHPIPAIRALLPWPFDWWMARGIPQAGRAADAAAAVQRVTAARPDFVKVIYDEVPPGGPRMGRDVLRALVSESHRRGLRVFVHVGSSQDALDAAQAGADALAHGVYRGPLSDEAVRELARRQVPVAYTLSAWLGVAAIAQGRFQPTEFDRATTAAAALDAVAGDRGLAFARTPVLGPMAAAAIESAPDLPARVRRLHQAGVPLLVGSDSPLPGTYVGGSLHEEMRRFVEAGVPAGEVLLAATGRAARLLTSRAPFGTVEPGMLADLVLVEGNPLAQITDTRRIVAVVTAGRMIERHIF